MDPNLFHVDLERLFEVLMAIVVLSFFVERALALVVGHRAYVALERRGFKGAKEFIVFGVSAAVCFKWQFDAVSILLVRDESTKLGYLITAGVIAGGSKASIKLFRDLMNTKTQAEVEYDRDTRAPGSGNERPRKPQGATAGEEQEAA